jgi:hypothetical protein
MTATETTRGPAIVESYRDFEPPSNFRRLIETLLLYVPPKHLIGLQTIVLTNRSGLTRDKRRQKVWSRNRKILLADASGSYSRATKSSPATVSLYVDNLARNAGWMLRVPFVRYMMPADVLYHEVGHHIHTVHKPIHEEREDVAEDWSRKLYAHFVRKHYWYIYPFLYIVARIVSPIAKKLRRSSRAPQAPD